MKKKDTHAKAAPGWRRYVREDGQYMYEPVLSVILKDDVSLRGFPGNDEIKLLRDERFIEAILTICIRLDQQIKEIVFYTKPDRTMGRYMRVLGMEFGTLITHAKKRKIITSKEFAKLELLRKARNEVAHTLNIHNNYISAAKCKPIVEDCLPILSRTFDVIIHSQEGWRSGSCAIIRKPVPKGVQ